jgi:hypothetical protein
MGAWSDGLAELALRRRELEAIAARENAEWQAQHGKPSWRSSDGPEETDEYLEANGAVNDALDALPYQGAVPRAAAWFMTI